MTRTKYIFQTLTSMSLKKDPKLLSHVMNAHTIYEGCRSIELRNYFKVMQKLRCDLAKEAILQSSNYHKPLSVIVTTRNNLLVRIHSHDTDITLL